MAMSSRFLRSRTRVVMLAAAAVALAGSAPASATFSSCYFSVFSHTIVATAGTDSGSFMTRDAAGVILADGAPCLDGLTAATVANTDTILITSNDPNVAAAIDLSGGPFAPGFTDEGDGSSEIEIAFNLPGDSLPTVIGGPGFDSFTAGTDGSSLAVNLNPDEAADDADVTVAGTPTLTLAGAGGSDTIFGSGGDGTGGPTTSVLLITGGDDGDWLVGGNGPDSLYGGPGFDQLEGAGGDDRLDGGADADWAEYYDAPSSVTATLPGGTAPGQDGYGATDTYVSIERIAGSAHPDVLTGDGDDNIINGGGGADQIALGAGADLSWGGIGNDVIHGGSGPDGISGDEGDDSLYGESGNDDISDSDGNDSVFGGLGADELDASGFVPDVGIGPSGTDLLSGGPGIDTVHYWPRTAGVSVSLDGAANDGAAGENDNVGGPADDVENVEGGLGADTIAGNGGPNTIDGNTGNDVLSGGGGVDLLRGGIGDDSFAAEDGVRDFVFGGAGFDSAALDRRVDGDPVSDVAISVEART